ncbi:acyl-CoA-binding domain-containing protein 5-like isoform X3 [Conger conger]|uniref:acyl-CoA-binding domain-containing protein 5-like isoform X3 n=1 Tax=Conger conger TaxID=82655 RepID=UPI002A5A1B83|nr:acyl-CoA-binding domain-containing protein 5-like isoform X3 [Conger conger]
MAEEKTIYEIRFDAAVKVIQSLPRNGPFQPSNETMLKFYSYYKQAIQGPCTISRPSFWDPVGKVKWDAWNSLGDMPKEKAMIAYVDEMKLILETVPVTEQVMELLDVLGPFYDVVENKSEENNRASEEEALAARLKAEDPTGKSEVPLSNGSVEHSVSSLTNGTHSSLNSDCVEEELACSLEPPGEPCETNGPLSDLGEEVPGLLQLGSDSDGEVYCDSMEQFGLEEGSVVLINHSLETGEVTRAVQGLLGEACRRDDPQGGDGGLQDGVEPGAAGGPVALSAAEHSTSLVRRGRGSSVSGSGPGVGPPVGLLGGGGEGERWGSEGGAEGTLNEQIAMALARLQEDMQSVLHRLQTLEALTASQTRSLSLQQNYGSLPVSKKPRWWPFHVPPGAVAFAVVWPFVVHWLVWLYFQRRRRYSFPRLETRWHKD